MKRYLILHMLLMGFFTGISQDKPAFNKKELEKKLGSKKGKAQQKYIDSVGRAFMEINPETAVQYFDFIIKYARIESFDDGVVAYYYLRRGQQLRKIQKYALAIQDLLKAEDIFLSKKNLSGLQEVCLAFANVYTRVNDNVKAIKFALRAKDYANELKNQESLSVVYNTLANLYKQQGLRDKAFGYYKKSMELIVKRKNKDQEALLLDNISMLWVEEKMIPGHLDSAGWYNAKAIAIARETNDIMLELQLLPNAASIAEEKKEFNEQLQVSLRGKNIADSMKIEGYQTYMNLNYASALVNTGNPKKAVKIFRSCIKVLVEYEDYFGLASSTFEIARAYEAQNRNDSALFYFKLNKVYEDTLSILRSKDKVNELLAKREIDLKESKIKNLKELNAALNEKENLSKEKDRLKTIILYGAVVLLLIIVILLVITFKRFRDNKKLSKEISLKNLALVTKNNEITDSINYAKRIQQALLPSQNELTNTFPDSFILFKPKDIVSGDFYWIHQEADIVFIAVGDCTGHGVPGGFMSMLGHSFLNQIVNEKHVHEPAKILDQLREKVITSLRQTGAAGENKDGMDITFVKIDLKKNKLVYAAANNSFYLMQADLSAESSFVITELKADKQPIGYYSNVLRPFIQHEMDIQKGDTIYLFSDGYPDQFGGAKGKKLKHSTLQKLLIEGSSHTMQKQAEVLEKAFMAWKGPYEQTDDVCVVGIRI